MKELKEISVEAQAINIEIKGSPKPSIYNEAVVLEGKTLYFSGNWKLHLSKLSPNSVKMIHQLYDTLVEENIPGNKIELEFIAVDKSKCFWVTIYLNRDQSRLRKFFKKLDSVVTKMEDKQRNEESERVREKIHTHGKNNRSMYGKRSFSSFSRPKRGNDFDDILDAPTQRDNMPRPRKLTKHEKLMNKVLRTKFETDLSDDEIETSAMDHVKEAEHEEHSDVESEYEEEVAIDQQDNSTDGPKKKNMLGKRLSKRRLVDSDDDEETDLFDTRNHLNSKKVSREFEDEDDEEVGKSMQPKDISSYFTSSSTTIGKKKSATVTPLRTNNDNKSEGGKVIIDGGITDEEDGNEEQLSKEKIKTDRISKYFQKTNKTSDDDDEILPDIETAPSSKPIFQKRSLMVKKSPIAKPKPSSADVALTTATSPRRKLKVSSTPLFSPAKRTKSPLAKAISPKRAIKTSPVTNPYKTAKSSSFVKSNSPKTGHMGLKNLGNTCYMGSSLQMLFSIPEFFIRLDETFNELKNIKMNEEQTAMPLCKSLLSVASKAGILHSITDTPNQARGYVDPSEVKKAIDKVTPKFSGYEQRDAHEFLSDLLDILHEELNDAKSASGNMDLILPTDEFFRLDLDVCLTCNSCQYSRVKSELYRHISVDVNSLDLESGNQKKHSSLEDCLVKFFQSGKQELKCEKCDTGNSVTQSLKISQVSKALLLHMKRFIVTTKVDGDPPEVKVLFHKDTAPVDCGSSLELKDAESSQGVYDLRGVVRHIGSTAFSGHYTADALRPTKENSHEWINFDDSNSTVTSIDMILHNDRSQRNNYMMLFSLKK